MPTLARNVTQAKDVLMYLIPKAARHNAECRKDAVFNGSRAMVASGEYTLITALYMELDERVSRDLVERALIELSREGLVYTMPESCQGDLTDYDRLLALRTGCQEHHWVKVMDVAGYPAERLLDDFGQ